jgi:hypothetical protein
VAEAFQGRGCHSGEDNKVHDMNLRHIFYVVNLDKGKSMSVSSVMLPHEFERNGGFSL